MQMNLSCILDDGFEVLTVAVMIIQALRNMTAFGLIFTVTLRSALSPH